MRVYHLRLTAADFEIVGPRWTSSTIDLYSNASYRNFSVTRSQYGLNDLGDGTWTGLSSLDPTHTDTGTLVEGRYLDTSGRIDLVSWSPEITLTVGEGPVSANLTVYSALTSDSAFPEEFSKAGPVTPAREIDLVDAPRYARLELDFDAPAGVVFTATIYVRVEIDVPLMAPMYRATRRLLDQYPEWMALREADVIPAVPELATPTTVGGAYLNAAAGQWLEDLTASLTDLELETYIDTAELKQIAWVYRADRLPQFVYSVEGDGVDLARAFDLEEFYEVVNTVAAPAHVCFWDEEDDALYTRKSYTALVVNGITFTQEPHLVRNTFDEIGLFVDLTRIQLEDNESFRHRILDVHRNKPGVGVINFKLALRRELNIWKVYGATPSSDYAGATPEVLGIPDLEQDPLYVAPDGMPTERFIALVDRLAVDYPTTWGRFRWDMSFWDLGGAHHEGYGLLPYRMDATPLAFADTQAGVGDANDLLLLRPDAITGPHDFTYRLKLRGREKASRTEYLPVTFEFDIYGQSDRKIYANPKKTVWLTVEVETHLTDNPVYTHSFQLSATSDVALDRATPSATSYGVFRFLDDDGTGTDDALTYSHRVNGTGYPGVKIPLDQIKKLTLRSGKWSVQSQAYILNEGTDTFDAWFSHAPGTMLQFDTAEVSAPSYLFSSSAPFSPVVMKSKVVAFTVGKFTSERSPHRLTVNSAVPSTDPKPETVTIPNIVWDPYQEATPNREIVVQLKTTDVAGVFGAQAVDEGGVPSFLTDNYVLVNGNGAWTNGKKTLPAATTSITFGIDDGADYPLTATVWTLFEANQVVPYEGVVDENGPWRNGQPSAEGNTNFNLRTANVTRASFGIPETTDRVITWMGVEVLDDPRVVAWLDSNTVQPAVTDASSVEYPVNAIAERLAAGVYYFDPFIVRARLRPQVAPTWDPYIHSGWYYQAEREGYVYADPVTEVTTTKTKVLLGVARQGAPIVARTTEATPREFRQVVFFDQMATPDLATPTTLSLESKEVVQGTGTTTLYLAYTDVYGVSVKDLVTGQAVAAGATTSTNEVTTTVPTDRKHAYQVTYTLARSFMADHEFEQDGTQRTKLVFDKAPATIGVPSYTVTYETSRFDPATPIDLPLSPLHTSFHEGYVFLSHNEYGLDRIEVVVSPTKIVADGLDYLVVSIRSLDRYGNPKANQSFTISSTFGTLDDTSLTTDNDGFVSVMLTAGAVMGSATGTITINGIVPPAVINFEIDAPAADEFRLLAVPAAEQIPADGKARNIVYGQLQDSDFAPVAGATIRWKRARSLHQLFTVTPAHATPGDYAGQVTTDARGGFTIGPFVAQLPAETGYWFLVAEVDDGSAGDVVFWHEYPDLMFGVNPNNKLPQRAVQDATPVSAATPYSRVAQFPSNYDEATPYASATPVTTIWLPPKWFALTKYSQYQLGLLGLNRGAATPSAAVHKYRKVI